ncbi:hypothetical protein RR46_06408 [Papilio xuthus]|uniref:Uncharacterized protein n=1 Tax=Papilio xuthus TaxID=66420 RepID=A0A194QCQ7_PAPXU|nr:hypothetical protein RR46_06408 [Papilio xuthus]
MDKSGERAAVGEGRTPKSTEALVDLTSDSEDEVPLKRKVPQPKHTPPADIKADDYSSSNAEAVSSSGYRSPGACASACGVISLDSPSPPSAHSPPAPAAHPHPAHTAHTADTSPPQDCTTNNSDREGNESAPTHWAPYADAERDNHEVYRSFLTDIRARPSDRPHQAEPKKSRQSYRDNRSLDRARQPDYCRARTCRASIGYLQL